METKVSAQKIFDKYYSELESNEKRMDDGYTYESTFIEELVRKVGTEVLQVSTGRVPKRGKWEKKVQTSVGKFDISGTQKCTTAAT